MPEFKPGLNPADRALHLHVNTFFRKDGTVINLPDDLLESAGDLLVIDRFGNPLGVDGQPAFTFEGPEVPDGWFPYVGTAREGVNGPTKQVTSALPINRPSFMADQPLFPGDLPPEVPDAAPIPRPEAPLLVVESADIVGYSEATLDSPYFVKYSYVKAGKHSDLSPPALVPPLENGQSIRVSLPEEVPEGVTHIGVWLTQPGTSTLTSLGAFFLQREVEVRTYNPGTYVLSGPFRFDLKEETAANETRLPSPAGKAGLEFIGANMAARPGVYQSRIAWADENGESIPNSLSSTVTVEVHSFYETFDDEGESEGSTAGRGRLMVQRPQNPPPGATGWRAYIFVEGNWHVIYYSKTQDGNERPMPLSRTVAFTGGWSSASDNEHATTQTEFLVQRDLPLENTSGIENPEEAMEEPVVIGAVRPPAGTYYALVTESVRDKESIPSPTSSVTITADEVFRVIRQDPVNRLPNGIQIELGADGLPLDQTTVVPDGGAWVEASSPASLVLQTVPGEETETYSSTTRAIKVDHRKEWRIDVGIAAENPSEGAFEGSVEVVLEQLTSAGAVTQNVLTSLSAVGETRHKEVVKASTASSGLKWLSSTRQTRILVRFAGTTKNLTARIRHRRMAQGKHHPRRRKRPWIEWEQFNPPDTITPPPEEEEPVDPEEPPPDPIPEEPELPPGGDSGVTPPPEIPPPPEPVPDVVPVLVEWPTPDRPLGTGTATEPKHTFESALPTGWTQTTAGQGALSRFSASTLTGSWQLRSLKSVGGP